MKWLTTPEWKCRYVPFLALIAVCSTMYAAAPEAFFPGRIGAWLPEDGIRKYDTLSIYDYMDGAAEIYKLYAFKELYVSAYAAPGRPALILEVFEMDCAEDAYGVFSHIRSGTPAGIGQESDDTGSMLCFWKDTYFISLRTERVTPDSREALQSGARLIDAAIPGLGSRPAIVELLPVPGLQVSGIRYVHSFLLLNMHYFIASRDILNLTPLCEVVLASYLEKESEFYLLLIRYPSAQNCLEGWKQFRKYFFMNHRELQLFQEENGTWTGGEAAGEYLIIIFEAPGLEQFQALLTALQVHLEGSRP